MDAKLAMLIGIFALLAGLIAGVMAIAGAIVAAKISKED